MTKSPVFYSLIWSVVKNWGGRFTSLIVFALLTRLLDAHDIGAVAFVAAIITILSAVAEMGLAEYLIYKEDTPAARNQIFWFQIYVTLAMYILLALAGPPLLHSMARHDAANMLPYLGLVLPLVALSSVQDAIQRAALQFRAIAIRSLIGMVAGGVVGVTLAASGAGMWSLVFKHLTEMVVMAAIMWRTSNWRPDWGCDWRGFRKVFNYTRYMAGSRLLDVFTANVDELIVGLAVGQQQLGFYSIGKKLYTISIELLGGTAGYIAGPLLARANGNATVLWNMFVQAIRYGSYLIVPLYAALYFFAPVVIPLLFGQQWAGAVWILQSFCFVGMLFPFHQFTWPMLMVAGDAADSFRYALIRNLGGLAILAVAAFLSWEAFVLAQAVRSVFTIGTGWLYLRRVIAFRYAELGMALLPGLLAAGAVGATFVLLAWTIGQHFIVQASGVTLVLGLTYLLMLAQLRRVRS
ncbi:oligosaccharide flippase family protein [Massilia sp.]|uniref:oligosaccharide flippase family protein n=1 Tax=Massilia sp. TaxID=1882437 RepID=UPI002899F557|nr:oligosaccharide flippase family protein [Massilia sp.]